MPVATSKPIAKAAGKRDKIDAKQAVEIAVRTFTDFYPDLSGANLQLEEIEDSDRGGYWLITLGYDAKRTLSAHHKIFQSENYRAYKVFRIDSTTGKVGAMKIKALE